MWIIVLVTGILLVAVVFILMPHGISNLASHPDPVQGYEESVQRVDMFREHEPQGMNPLCRL